MANGYGVINLGPGLGNELVHRFAWEQFMFEIPEGYDVGHGCHDEALRIGECEPGPCWHRMCCNPFDCLVLQQRGDNLRAAGVLGKKKCPAGHLLIGDNVRVNSQGTRVCVICKRIHDAEYRARRFGYR